MSETECVYHIHIISLLLLLLLLCSGNLKLYHTTQRSSCSTACWDSSVGFLSFIHSFILFFVFLAEYWQSSPEELHSLLGTFL